MQERAQVALQENDFERAIKLIDDASKLRDKAAAIRKQAAADNAPAAVQLQTTRLPAPLDQWTRKTGKWTLADKDNGQN